MSINKLLNKHCNIHRCVIRCERVVEMYTVIYSLTINCYQTRKNISSKYSSQLESLSFGVTRKSGEDVSSAHTYKYIQAHTSTYTHIQVHTSTYKHIQVHTSTYKYIQTHTSTYKHIQAHNVSLVTERTFTCNI